MLRLLLKNDGYWRSLAAEQGDVCDVLFHYGNSLRRTICIARARGLPVVIRRYSNFGSTRLSLFADPIKYVAWVPQIDSRSTFFLHSDRKSTRLNSSHVS